MAKYTELLSEYIKNGGEFPAVFDKIEGFEDLFIGHYIDREIGFETPVLFSVKLETRANIVIPAYAKRIAEIEAAEENLINNEKVRTKTGNITRDYGERNNTDTFKKQGEIKQNYGAHTDKATNTKRGEVVNSGKDTTTNIAADKVHNEADLPFTGASENNVLTKINTDKGYTDTVEVDHSNTEKYNDYIDMTENAIAQRTDTESYNGYQEISNQKDLARQDQETYNDIKEIESGFTPTEAGALFKALEEKVYLLKLECLKEFDNLFMQVF